MIKNIIIAVVLNTFVPFCVGLSVGYLGRYYHWNQGVTSLLVILACLAAGVTALSFWKKALGQ